MHRPATLAEPLCGTKRRDEPFPSSKLEQGQTVTDKSRKETKTRKDQKIDQAGNMSFPASDAPAHGRTTATEPPARPIDRKAPAVTKEEIEWAKRGDGHKN